MTWERLLSGSVAQQSHPPETHQLFTIGMSLRSLLCRQVEHTSAHTTHSCTVERLAETRLFNHSTTILTLSRLCPPLKITIFKGFIPSVDVIPGKSRCNQTWFSALLALQAFLQLVQLVLQFLGPATSTTFNYL